jgi:hypothetical protein
MTRLADRLARAERRTPTPFGLSAMLDDELAVQTLRLCREVLKDPEADAELREAAQRESGEIEDGIRRAAAAQLQPTWAAHVAWVTRCWKGSAPFVPSVIGHDYDSWEKPRAMERRAALLDFPEVRRLVDEGMAAAAA